MATRTIVASGANGSTTFSSPALWEASLPGTLTEIEIGEQEDFSSTGVVTFAGVTTSSSFYIHYRGKAGDEHLGYNAGGGAKIIDDGSNDGVVRLAVGHIRVSNLIIESTGNRFGFTDAGNNIVDARIYSNIIYSSASTSTGRGINCASAGGTFRLYNNTIYDYGGGGSVGYGIAVANSTCSVLASNNTVYGCRFNFVIISGSITPKNNISDSPRGGDCYSGSFTSASNNLSSDATSPNSTFRNKNPVYVGEGSVGSRDLRLSSSDTDCKDLGADLSADDPAITVDIIGTSRPQGSAPDLGSFEVAATGATGTGTPAITLPTAAGSGISSHPGAGTPVAPLPTASGVGHAQPRGQGAPAITLPTAAGTAVASHPGSGAPTAPLPTAAGTGVASRAGTGALVVPLPTAAGTATASHAGTGAPTAPLPTAAGSGVAAHVGAGTPVTPLPTAAGTGIGGDEVAGSGAPSIPLPTASGVGHAQPRGQGAPLVALPTAAGTGTASHPGTGAPTVPAATAGGSGVAAHVGSGSPTAPIPTASGTGSGGGAGTATGSGAPSTPMATASGTGVVTSVFVLILQRIAVLEGNIRRLGVGRARAESDSTDAKLNKILEMVLETQKQMRRR